MAAQPPKLILNIPDQIINEGASCYIDLKEYFSPAEDLAFVAQLTNGESFPPGLICTSNGLLSGIPAANSQGRYDISLSATNNLGKVETTFVLTIKERIGLSDPSFLTQLKAQVWEALENNLPIPEITSLLERPISTIEIYYLLQRFATLTIWDVYNLEPAGEKILLTLPEASPHFNIYDRGSCLVGCPKDLFSHERTLADTLQTARVMAREVYKRGWSIEFSGFTKMTRAAWVECQHLKDQHGKAIDIMHYEPGDNENRIYSMQAQAFKFGNKSSNI